MLDRKVKDVVAKVENELKKIFVNFVWSGTNLYSMNYIDTDAEKIRVSCELQPNESYNLVVMQVGSFDLEGIESENMTRNPFQVTFINLLIQKLMKSTNLM